MNEPSRACRLLDVEVNYRGDGKSGMAPMWSGRFANAVAPLRATTLIKVLKADGWRADGCPLPHIEVQGEHDDHGPVLIARLPGDLLEVPRTALAETAAQFQKPIVVLTSRTPPAHLNQSMIGQGVYFLRQDGIIALPAILNLIAAEKARQREAASVSEGARNVSEAALHAGQVDSRADTVRQLFEAVLGRPATEGDVSHYASVAHGPGVARLAGLLASSSEHTRRAMARGFNDLMEAAREGRPSPYSAVISFGSHCATGTLLQQAGLKAFSTPFDWIFSSCDVIVDCLADDFESFLDPLQHESKQEGEGAHHVGYRDRYGVESLFNHRDPNRGDNLAYYQRCVARFRKLATGTQPFLGIMVTPFWHSSVDQCALVARAVSRYAPTATMIFLRVQHPDPANYGCLLTQTSGRHRIIDFTPLSALGALNFHSPIDAMMVCSLIHALAAQDQFAYAPESMVGTA